MPQDSSTERGNGFLSLRLERIFDMELRRQVALRDWTLAALVVIAAQIAGVHALNRTAFVVLFLTVSTGLAVWYWVVPRLQTRTAFKYEVAVSALSGLAVVALVAASGGASSPYVFFYALMIVFIAAFIEHASIRIVLIAFGCVCALAPLAYDWAGSVAADFVATIVIAVVVWVAAAALIALKRTSAVNAELRARRLAYVDPLTGAGNRRALEEYAEGLVAADTKFGLAHVRVGGIDEINRRMGHFAGDEALRRVVGAMREASLDVDQVARIGGVEFAVLLPGGGLAAPQRWRTRFHERLEIANAAAEDGARVVAGVGCSASGDDGRRLNDLLSAADAESEDLSDMAPVAAGPTPSPAERASHLRELLDAESPSRPVISIESVTLPAGILAAVPAAIALGVAVGATGGASSVLLSVAILIAAYFATFGSRRETLVATVALAAALIGAVIAAGEVTTSDAIRVMTVLATMGVIADTVQRNSRMLTLAERRAGDLSLVDSQTGLGNSSAFERELMAVIPRGAGTGQSRAERIDGLPAVIALDIADFQGLRGSLGHAGSDLLLLEIAEALRDVLAGTGKVYRIGSDEFATIIRAHHRQHVDDVAARCIDAIGELAADERYAGAGLSIAFRYGGALWEPGMRAADLASAAVAEQPLTIPSGGGVAVELK